MKARSLPNILDAGIDMLARAGVVIIVCTVAVCVVLGALAALVGGSFTSLGSGPGGLGGMPMLLFLLAALLGLPSLVRALFDLYQRRWKRVGRVVIFIAPLAIAIYFFEIPHAIDPCALGIWAPRSSWASIPLCEAWGGGWNIHARFHLLLHAAPTLLPVALYWMALKKWYPNIAYLRRSPAAIQPRSVEQTLVTGR